MAQVQEVPAGTTLERINELKEWWFWERGGGVNRETADVWIHFWMEGPWGLRIAEISFVEKDGLSGATLMRHEPAAAAVILYAEEFLIEENEEERLNVMALLKAAFEMEVR